MGTAVIGDLVGVGVGITDGAGLGDWLGLRDGFGLGRIVGYIVGLGEGPRVGADVGTGLGTSVGTFVGLADGAQNIDIISFSPTKNLPPLYSFHSNSSPIYGSSPSHVCSVM